MARSLAEDGCTTYTRGVSTISDRPLPRSDAGNCYEAIRGATGEALRAR